MNPTRFSDPSGRDLQCKAKIVEPECKGALCPRQCSAADAKICKLTDFANAFDMCVTIYEAQGVSGGVIEQYCYPFADKAYNRCLARRGCQP